MKNSKLIRTGVIILFAAALAGSIGYQNYVKKMQVGRIMNAADKLDTLVNLHFVTSTTDESEQEGTSGISTEVWADLDSKKWVAVYSSIEGDNVTIYQSQMYDGEKSYGINESVDEWTELAQTTDEIPYFSTLNTFYYNEDDFTNVKVTTEGETTVVTATLSEAALEKVQEDGVESANQTYLTYVENGQTDEAESAKLLLDCAKQTTVTSIEVSYTINADGLLSASTYKEYYSRPAIVTENDEKTLGDIEEHAATTTREVVSYNSEEATTTLHEYLDQLKE